jgi:hypothetical protein
VLRIRALGSFVLQHALIYLIDMSPVNGVICAV